MTLRIRSLEESLKSKTKSVPSGGDVKSTTIGFLATLIAGVLHASPVACSFNGGATTQSCYGYGVSFVSNDSLNFLSAFGSAGGANNPYNEAANGPLQGTTANGVQ